MPWSDSRVLILSAEPLRRQAIVSALQVAGAHERHEFMLELSDLVFAVVGRPRALVIVDLQGQPPLPPPVSALLRHLAPEARLLAVDEGARPPPGFDAVVRLDALPAALRPPRVPHGD